ncbi:MAG: PIG-L deacetylase family protein [Pirellulales bacterium]
MKDVEEILVIAPHPDDESLGCGGTIAMLTALGKSVDVVLMTRGEWGVAGTPSDDPSEAVRLANTREAEVRAACRVLGVRDVVFLSGRDCRTHQQSELVDELITIAAARHYRRAFVCWPADRHTDHRATFRWFQQALRHAPTIGSVWLYEVWSPLEPNTIVPIDAYVDAKRAAIAEHRSQLEVLNYLEGFLALGAYRALLSPPSRYAEAFIVQPRDVVLSWNLN